MESTTNLKIVNLESSPKDFAGNLVDLFEKIMKQHSDDVDMLQITMKEFGNIYYVLNAELVGKILAKSSSKIIKVPHGHKVLERFIGDSVFVSNGKDHKNQRRWINPAFNKKRFDVMTDGIVNCTQEFISNWKNGDEINIFNQMMDLAIRIITKNMFGEQINSEQFELINQTLNRLLQIFVIPRPLTQEEEQEVEGLIASFDEVVYTGIQLRKKNSEQFHDLLSMLVQAQSKSEYAEGTEQEMRNNVATMFLAGYEATATALTWTWYLLAQHPEVENKFWDELDTVLSENLPDFLDVQKLKYTNQIFLESMRLYPPSHQIGRAVIEDIELEDYTISKGSVLTFNQYIMHRSQKYFTNPNEFNPERFTNEFIRNLDKNAYFPFGLGSRICIGKDFSLVLLVLVAAVIGKQYRFELLNKEPVRPVALTTLVPETEIKMKVFKR
ncbi:cytochrome P450 [Bacillus sp. C1]